MDDKEINKLLKKIDFVRIWSVMIFVNWRWQNEVVTVAMLKAKAEKLVKEVDGMDASLEGFTRSPLIQSGGFIVSKDIDGLISVTFAIAHATEDEVIE